jgi:threonine synthase
MRQATRLTGILWSPEGAASHPSARRARTPAMVAASDEVVLLNTGSGLKTLDLF